MALRRRRSKGKRAYGVTGLGRSRSHLNTARRFHALDDASTAPASVIPAADVVVLCLPVQTIVPFAKRILPLMKKGAVLTDVGSVKGPVVDQLKPLLAKRPDLTFVGGHPLAGSEKSGVEHARADLFKGAICILTKDGSKKKTNVIERLWRDAGARCLHMTAREHDHVVAMTSHLPHLLAFSLFQLVHSSSKHEPRLRAIAARSFNDMTRITASDPTLWSGIIAANHQEIKKAVRHFSATLTSLLSSPAPRIRKMLTHLSQEKKKW